VIPRHLKITFAIFVVATVVTAIYVWRVQRRAAKVSVANAALQPVSPPITGSAEHVVFYVADDAQGVLSRQDANVALPSEPAARVRELVRALLARYSASGSSHTLPPGAEVDEAYLVKNNLAILDMNSAFADGHRSGILVEELTVLSLVETVAANNPQITAVKILVDGKERDTLAGHADLADSYDLATVNSAAARLQNQ